MRSTNSFAVMGLSPAQYMADEMCLICRARPSDNVSLAFHTHMGAAHIFTAFWLGFFTDTRFLLTHFTRFFSPEPPVFFTLTRGFTTFWADFFLNRFTIPSRVGKVVVGFYKIVHGKIIFTVIGARSTANDLFKFDHVVTGRINTILRTLRASTPVEACVRWSKSLGWFFRYRKRFLNRFHPPRHRSR